MTEMDFSSHYRSLSNEDLLRFASDAASLTPEARHALQTEFDRRHFTRSASTPLLLQAQTPARTRSTSKVFIALTVIVGFIVLTGLEIKLKRPKPRPDNNLSSGTINGSTKTATPSDEYNPASAEVLLPYELSKNPYKWKGHSGVLDTRRAPYITPNGSVAPMLPLGSIKFDKMLDEHTALYDVMTLGDTLMPDGQIAVILTNSDPPDLQKLWRVLVMGSIPCTNAFGGDAAVTAVKFEEYYRPSPQSVPEDSAAPSSSTDTMAPVEEPQTETKPQ